MWHTHIEKNYCKVLKKQLYTTQDKHDDVMMVTMLIMLMRMTKVAMMLIMVEIE